MSPSATDDDEADSPVVQNRYDWSITPPSVAVPETVGAATGTPSVKLPPMYDVVDLDALDRVVRHTRAGRRASVRLTFRYLDYDVTVGTDGTVRLDSIGEP
jgi:hypothetical protein